MEQCRYKRPSIAIVLSANGGVKKKEAIVIKFETTNVIDFYRWAKRYVSVEHSTNFVLIESYDQLKKSIRKFNNQNIFIDWVRISKEIEFSQKKQLDANTMLVAHLIVHRQMNNFIVIATRPDGCCKLMPKVTQNIDYEYLHP